MSEGKPIRFTAHAWEQARFRGATEAEVLDAIRTSPWMPAKPSRLECSKKFPFAASWNGNHYETKRVRPIFAESEKEIVVITVYVYYF